MKPLYIGGIVVTLIRTLMSLRDVNQSKLAKDTGVSVTAISRYLNGTSEVGSDKLVKILSALEIDLDSVVRSDINRALGNEDEFSVGEDIKFLLDKASPITRKTIAETIITSFKNDKSTDTKSRVLRIKKYKDSIKTVGRLA